MTTPANADEAAVRDALLGLIDGTVSADHETTVAEAERALRDVRRAARFVARGGRERLRRAVTDAERRSAGGDPSVVVRGRRALDRFTALREAASGRSADTFDRTVALVDATADNRPADTRADSDRFDDERAAHCPPFDGGSGGGRPTIGRSVDESTVRDPPIHGKVFPTAGQRPDR